jgi:hypothetical protein
VSRELTVKVAIRDVQLPSLSNAVIRSTRINRVSSIRISGGRGFAFSRRSLGSLSVFAPGRSTIWVLLCCHLSRSLETDLIRTATSINLTLVYSVSSPSNAPDLFEGVPGLLFSDHNLPLRLACFASRVSITFPTMKEVDSLSLDPSLILGKLSVHFLFLRCSD